jgi:DnaJ like chaperone protein
VPVGINYSPFEKLLLASENQVGTSVLLVLAWIAASDGSVDPSEKRELAQIAKTANHPGGIEPFLALAETQDVASLQLASELLRLHFAGEKAELFLSMALGVALADGMLDPGEHHIILFLADLLGVSAASLGALFQSITGRPIPDPVDLSAASTWEEPGSSKRDHAHGTHGEDNRNRNGSSGARPRRADGSTREAALAVLGLAGDASAADIKLAYRRLASVHHPDRFSTLGDEAVATATRTFQRIQAAYEVLVRDA